MTNTGVNDIIWRCTTLHIENNVENMSLQFISICQKMFLSLWNTVKNYKMNFFLLFTTILGIQARSFNWNKVRIRLLTRGVSMSIVNMYFQRQSGWTLNSIGYNAGLSKHFEFVILGLWFWVGLSIWFSDALHKLFGPGLPAKRSFNNSRYGPSLQWLNRY